MKVTLNLSKAIEIDKDQRREARGPLFEKMDVAALQCLERGDTEALALVQEAKQELRDVTANTHYQHCNSFEELCNCWPESTLGPCPYHQNHD